MTQGAAAWSRVRRLLAIRLDNLGDVLMTTPALAAVRESLPGVQLTLLASPAGAALAPCLPMVDAVIGFEAPWVKSEAGDAPGAEAALIERLAAERFDAAIVFTVCTQSALPAALLCRLAGIPLRLAHSRENPYRLLTDWVPEADAVADGMRHEVRRQLDLVASVGLRPASSALKLHYAAPDVAAMRQALRAAGADPLEPYVVVHPGATAASRRWPAERFADAAAALARDTGLALVFSGSAADEPLVNAARERLPRDVRAASLAGRLDLGGLAALIGGAELTLCNNSAPAHIAAAVGTPVVVLYALTNPQHTPWQAKARVLNCDVPCRHCLKSACPQGHHACLSGVSADDVARAATELLTAHRAQEKAAA